MATPPTTTNTASNAEQPQPLPLPSLKATEGTVEKFIRTFATDFETLKKGGRPDLAPLSEKKEEMSLPVVAPADRPALPAPLNLASQKSTVRPAVETPAPKQESAPTRALRPAVTIPLPSPEPVPVRTPTPPTTAPLETYEGDFTERMRNQGASTATVLAAEQDSAPVLVQAQSPKFSRSSILYSIAGGILIIASGVGAYIAYMRYIASSAPVVLTPGAAAPIFVDDRKTVSGIGTVLLRAIQQSIASQLASGSVRLLYLETATSTSVFSALQLPAPGALLRNINAAQSMAGVVNTGGVQSPFFILSVSSYSTTFAGMLQWEKTMPRDLGTLFPAYPPLFVATTTTAGQATTTMVLVANTKPGFYDEVVSNHDVRVYRDAAGRVLLLYGYWNQTTLVIARDAAAFSEIIGRLATSRTP
ncbi:MAG: hypothetical protein NUV90_01535 [Candidatus Parcubacteria bacterium]|nr:hypothetical protein [Candidatus Parcubacteria bacterium]